MSSRERRMEVLRQEEAYLRTENLAVGMDP